jgi:hypothetical protein
MHAATASSSTNTSHAFKRSSRYPVHLSTTSWASTARCSWGRAVDVNHEPSSLRKNVSSESAEQRRLATKHDSTLAAGEPIP